MNIGRIIFAGIIFFALALAFVIALKQMAVWIIPIFAIALCIVMYILHRK